MWPDNVFYRAKKWKPRAGVFYAEQKYDGHRVCVTHRFNEFHIWTSREGVSGEHGDLIDRVPLPTWRPPFSTAVECELVWPGHPAAEVPTAIKHCPDELRYFPFAVPVYQGRDVRDATYEYMHALIYTVTKVVVEYEELEEVNAEALLDIARVRGWEGWILKERGYSGWWKLKVEDTLDLRVSGFKPGTGKYEGFVGALVLIDGTGKEVALASGMTDEQRFALSPADIGRLCEVKFNEVTSGGRLKHPRFIRWRDDKGEADVVQRN